MESPIVISDSDTEDAPETLQLASDEIFRFIPSAVTNSQMTDLDNRVSFENEGNDCSQNSFPACTSRISKNQTPIKIVDINDIMKRSSSVGLQEIIEQENIASEKSNMVFSKTSNNVFVIRKENPAPIQDNIIVIRKNQGSIVITQQPKSMNQLLPIPTVINMINQSRLLPKTLLLPDIHCAVDAKPVSEPQPTLSINHTSVNKNAKNKIPSHNKVKELKKTKLSYPCLDLKKHNYKIDYEGFTYFDRLGFFKVEEKRARRCLNILQKHIKVRQQVLAALILKRKRRHTSQIHRDVQKPTMVDDLPKKAINKKRTNTTKLALCDKMEAKIESKLKKKIEPKLKKNIDKLENKPKLTKLQRVSSNEHLKQKTNDKQTVLQETKKPPTKLRRTYSKSLIDKYMVSKLKVPLYSDKFRFPPKLRVSSDGNLPATYIDKNNFEVIEQIDIHRNKEEIYFVNEHKIVTALYMDEFPTFKNAVQLRKVKILDKGSLSSDEEPSEPLDMKEKSDNKLTDFSNFMNSFHMSQNNSEFESNISSEHNYSKTNYS